MAGRYRNACNYGNQTGKREGYYRAHIHLCSLNLHSVVNEKRTLLKPKDKGKGNERSDLRQEEKKPLLL